MTRETNVKLHALFGEMADAMNRNNVSACLTQGHIFSKPIPMSTILVKEMVWRPTLNAATNLSSTRQLSDEMAEKLYKALSKKVQSRFGINVRWESAEELMAMEENQ